MPGIFSYSSINYEPKQPYNTIYKLTDRSVYFVKYEQKNIPGKK